MAVDDRHDEELTRDLLSILHDDESDPPAALPDLTIRKIQASLTSRDLIDLTTFVFLMRFCAPLLDLIAAFFGHELVDPSDRLNTRTDRSPADQRSDRTSQDRSSHDE